VKHRPDPAECRAFVSLTKGRRALPGLTTPETRDVSL